MTVTLGPTLLTAGSVQTFCIDRLNEVFGVEVSAGGGDGGGGWRYCGCGRLGHRAAGVNHPVALPGIRVGYALRRLIQNV
jgi:hypothetical protein